MKLPKFLYGSRSTVMRASLRVTQKFVESGAPGTDYGDCLDTSATDARLLIDPYPGVKGFLLYAPLESFVIHWPDRLQDVGFCATLVADWIERDWGLLCLMRMPFGVKIVERSGLAWQFVRALDRAWPAFTDLDARFGPPALPRDLCGDLTTARAIVTRYISTPEKPAGALSMEQTHQAIRRILREGERELPKWVLGPGTT